MITFLFRKHSKTFTRIVWMWFYKICFAVIMNHLSLFFLFFYNQGQRHGYKDFICV